MAWGGTPVRAGRQGRPCSKTQGNQRELLPRRMHKVLHAPICRSLAGDGDSGVRHVGVTGPLMCSPLSAVYNTGTLLM